MNRLQFGFVGSVVYLLAKLKPYEQKEHFSLKEQNGLVWNLAYVRNGTGLPGGSNPQPPGWKSSTLTHWPTDPILPDPAADRPICVALGSDWAGKCLSEWHGQRLHSEASGQ